MNVTQESIQVDAISDAIEALRQGRFIIVVDDEDRENEGDLVMAAQFVTPEAVNFMAKEARGLICVPLTEKRAHELRLPPMVSENTAPHHTAFTVSVDYIGEGKVTGISAQDRARTIRALADPAARPEDFARPGHIFPLIARPEGVLRRAGHTEAAIDLMHLAGLIPVAVIVEIMNEDGSMARLPTLRALADKWGCPLITIKDLIAYRLRTETTIVREVVVDMPTKYGHFKLYAYRHTLTGEPHVALVKGSWEPDEPILVRVHSSCFTGDILGSLRCDCGNQLSLALRRIEAEGKGVLVYVNQEGRGIGLLPKMHAYRLQEEGLDTVEANVALGFKPDERDYGTGAQILRDLGVRKMRLMTNNPKKRAGLAGYDLEIVETVPLISTPTTYNLRYLQTKRTRLGHILPEDILSVQEKETGATEADLC
ncbi:MAG: bifunctional 3,4-dihydroxy-2-butanone-4-phosphate synthase/GTP cyclohydrolase II [Bacteroidia bacterium]|nr:bifunctional 3,4-dihydroxy-2-butanone-4-phosphate synthase/GTP cyclohydrolase II [Bacteroidia bacterium]MCX7651985.1 bifunctional 3,4-dihydroxy-2-butanone-4-phosphate synthase/GTP cyclohydrolase II [Bacteroidia bacterium]MDW8417580.1 bifunctional 3,4-dihydroxy-2-butanone-4-phosphate synthase/GTP cyclohydrolase II [Bacteroidia bacterium]